MPRPLHFTFDMERFTDYLLKFLTLHYRIERALDIGAGTLQQSLQLADEGIIVDAIEPHMCSYDVSHELITIHNVTAQSYTYPKNGFYDLVVCRMMLQRLADSDVERLLVFDVRNALLPDGLLYLMVPTAYVLPKEVFDKYFLIGRITFHVPESDFKNISAYIFRKGKM